MKKLTEAELQESFALLPKWEIADGKLIRDIDFPSFVEAIAFVNQVSELAERQDHHPDLDIRYTRLRISLISHDVDGLTGRDLRLAVGIDCLLAAR